MSQHKYGIILLSGPFEFGFFQPFVPQGKACFIPVQHFDFVALFIGEQEQSTAS
ncbi:hypothetical protein VRK_33860 [Vibrio sp. MEBiC08052]|nr:hypothetical protein [Vibrio sp. MEBiC08052]KUI97522.1 hypothetical protein VRK_33860 [Vibrio sp. MEBiC08052]